MSAVVWWQVHSRPVGGTVGVYCTLEAELVLEDLVEGPIVLARILAVDLVWF